MVHFSEYVSENLKLEVKQIFDSLVWEQTSIEKIELKKGPNLASFDMNI